MRITHWHLGLALIAGFFAGALLYPVAAPADHGNDLEIKSLEIDVAQLKEQEKELDRRIQGCLDWIMAHDREAINDDLRGSQHVLEAEHANLQWEFRSCLGGLGAMFLWMLYRQLNGRR
jgi:hypothetical protein